MNRVYTMACLLLMAGGISAQRTALAPHPVKLGDARKNIKPYTGDGSFGQAKDGATLWSEDFANGLAGNNGVGAWSTSGADGALWLYDTDGPNGDFSDPVQEHITSTTFANGFMIFDSNLSNDGCSGAGCIVRNGSLESPVLDLSGNPYVHLVFEQRLRFCCSADPGHFVEISTDGGATWPGRVQVDVGINANDDPGTITTRVNLGPWIIGNATQVRLRFNHDGAASGNITHYFWQLDDLKIVESPVNDEAITNAVYNEWFFDTATNYDSIEYGVYPFSQVRELKLKANVLNDGSADQPNTNVNISVAGPSTGSLDIPLGTLLAATKDSASYPFTPSASLAGDYTVTYTISSDSTDENNANNTGERTFEVSQYDYAIDNGATDGSADNGAAAYKICNVFHVTNDATLTAVKVAVTTDTDAGTIVIGELEDINNDVIAETEEHIVASNERNSTGQSKFITLKFATPQTLIAGEEYYVCMQHYGGSSEVWYATSGSSERTASLIYDTPTDTWFYTTETPMVRMTFDPNVGIEESDIRNGVGLGQNFPNPAKNGTTTINYSLTKGGAVTLNLHDLSGKLVRTIVEGTMGVGTHYVELNTADLNEGVYFYTLNVNGTQLTKRMTVIR